MQTSSFRHFAALTLASFAFVQCSSDPAVVPPSNDASADANVASDSGADVAADAPGGGSTFTVPSGGGNVTVSGSSQDYTFEFPASAVGKTITITAVSAATFGLVATHFRDFFKLAPSGTVFTDPVKMRPKDSAGIAPFALLFADGSKIGTYARLSGGAFPIAHFSGIGVPAKPKDFCLSMNNNGGAATNFCQEFSLLTAPPTFVQNVTNVGSETAVLGCEVAESCGLVQQHCCVNQAAGLLVGKGETWCPGAGGDNQNFTTVYSQPCKPDLDAGVDAGPFPSCSALAVSNGVGCTVTFDAGLCGRTVSSASCDGTTCTCGAASFPQAALCEDGSALTAAVVAKCP